MHLEDFGVGRGTANNVAGAGTYLAELDVAWHVEGVEENERLQ